MLIDTHTHINCLKKISCEESIENAKNNNVSKIIVPASNYEDIIKLPKFIKQFDNVYGMLGIHPEEAENWEDSFIEVIQENLTKEKIVGVGEIGLDYYWDKQHKDLQKDIFIKQIKLANQYEIPIAVHDRDAHKDCFDILKQYNKNSIVIMHCFSGSVEFALDCIKQGWYIAIGGVVTFKNALKTKEVAKNIPLNKMLLETDAPYLTPEPYRGRENQPAYVLHVAEEIAKLRGISLDEVAEITTANAIEIFKF